MRFLRPDPARQTDHCPTSSLPLTAVTTLTLLERPDRPQEIDLAKGRPQDIGEIKFAVRTLPQKKAGEADFAAGADDQIGVRNAGGVEMGADRLGRDPF